MAGQEDLRSAAARDKDFVGVDIDAMAQLIHQMNGAANAISGWLRTNGALPPSVPRTGLRQASAVQTWVGTQIGMLTRRRDYAVTHLDQGGHDMPRVSPGGLGAGKSNGTGNGKPRRSTPIGGGTDIGNFPDAHAAARAGTSDAAEIGKAHGDIPAALWKRLAANAGDPDYTHALYERLGPVGTADLIKAAGHDESHLTAVRTSLGVVSHHLTMDEKWLKAMLDRALDDGVRDEAVHLLAHAGLAHRTKVALGHLGLNEMINTRHNIPAPRPPHEVMIAPAADDPHAAVDLYHLHHETVHRALGGRPDDELLARLVAHATTAPGADPAAVRANAERLAGFRRGPMSERSE